MPRIYVGTYGKYNAGSIKGAWLDCEDYADVDEFNEACLALHSDEDDPEIMFQDWEDIPDGMLSESYVEPDLWEWLALNDDQRELLTVYRAEVDQTGTIEQAEESYGGTYRSEEDWAEQYADDTGMLESMPDNLKYYFDFAAFARDCRIGGDINVVEHEGDVWIFNNI